MLCRHGDTPIERYMCQVQHSLYEKGYNKTMEELRILAPDITCLEDFFGYDSENSPFVYDRSTEDAINPDWPPLETPRQEPPDTEAPKSKSKKKPNKRQRQREAVPPEEPPSHPSPTLPESQPNEDQQRRQGAITRSHARKTKQEVGHRHARRRRPASVEETQPAPTANSFSALEAAEDAVLHGGPVTCLPRIKQKPEATWQQKRRETRQNPNGIHKAIILESSICLNTKEID
ncbi:hypothetical protein ILUMI_19737 [Ignelater luminosus]|uniref:Uncharacterized protein n=1 Tax=Ignelater luminosus TaxID=2038154 RepID=A0A8K0CJW7_IGNLU|nr:hypothetical protein ILUMI_19737 [Ignelater luminosus]